MMATAFARRTVFPLRSCSRRSIHTTIVARAKVESDDLFSTHVQQTESQSESGLTAEQELRKLTHPPRKERFVKEHGRFKLKPDVRLTRFNQLLEHVADRSGRRPAKRPPIVRDSALIHLFDLATTPEQLEQVAELFPKWRDTGRKLTVSHSVAFVRRCEELKCPQLALKVFGDFSKYGLSLHTLSVGQRLLHSLHLARPLSDTIAAAALYNVYRLPPLATDLLSTTLLVRACYKEYGNVNARVVAQSLVPRLRKMIKAESPKGVPRGAKERANREVRSWMWTQWALGKVEKSIVRGGEDTTWLKTWLGRCARAKPMTIA